MKKYVVGVILMFCVIAVTWSGGRSASSGGTSSSGEGGTVEKPSKISFFTDIFTEIEDGQQAITDKYREVTGITLELIKPAHNQYWEKLELAFATGEIPDVINLNAANMQRYAIMGALYDITDLYANDDINKHMDKTILDGTLVNSRLYGLPYSAGNGTVTYYRGDWLAEAGLPVPKTYDEFINMLRAFKKNHPDAIPYTAPGIIYDEYPTYIYTVEFFQDATPDYVKINGKWVDGIQQPNMRAALERFRSVFAEGLIDKEIVTNKTSTAREKIFADMCGVMNYWAGPWHSQFNQRLQATNPKGKMDTLPAIQGVTYFDRVALGNAITAKARNPQGVYKYFLSAMFDRGPVQMLFTHGVEGIHYKIENGNLIKLPSLSNPQFTNTSGTHIKPDLAVDNWPEDPYKLPPEIIPSQQILRATAKIAPLVPTTSTGERNDADIHIARKKFLADVVYGNAGFDQALAAYKSSAGSLVDQVLAEMNK